MDKEPNMDINELLDKAYDGHIKPHELAQVVERIQKYYENPNEDDIHSLLQVLGYAGAFVRGVDINEYKKLVEKFIVFSPDPFVSVTALDVLCNDWDLTGDYIEQIKFYAKGGVHADQYYDVRVKAILITGEYVRKCNDKECLKILLEIFENKQEQKNMRQLAYSSICRAVGKGWEEFDEKIDIDTFSQNIKAQETIAMAYGLLRKT